MKKGIVHIKPEPTESSGPARVRFEGEGMTDERHLSEARADCAKRSKLIKQQKLEIDTLKKEIREKDKALQLLKKDLWTCRLSKRPSQGPFESEWPGIASGKWDDHHE